MARWLLFLFLACALAAATTGAPSEQPLRDQSASLVSGGLTRTYGVHLPPAYDGKTPLPLVFVLHGRLGDGGGMRRTLHFD